MNRNILLTSILIFLTFTGCNNKTPKMEKQLRDFLTHYDSVIKPLSIQINLASWNASISGKDEDFSIVEALQKQYAQYHSNKKDFAILSELKKSNAVKDSLLSRQLNLLYLNYLSNQADTNLKKEIIVMQSGIEKKYNNFRAEI